jgi:hypothetical protein
MLRAEVHRWGEGRGVGTLKVWVVDRASWGRVCRLRWLWIGMIMGESMLVEMRCGYASFRGRRGSNRGFGEPRPFAVKVHRGRWRGGKWLFWACERRFRGAML